MKNKFVLIAAIAAVLLVLAGAYIKMSSAPEATPTATEEVAEAAPASDLTETAESLSTDEAPAAEAASEATAPVETAPTEDTAQETETAPADGSLLAAPAALQLNVAELMTDRVMGNPDAPVTITEFASMTCPHCAHFATQVQPLVKAQLVETGKAKFIFREFPLDQYALKASMLARCAPADKFYDLIEVIFRNQDRWVKAEDPIKSLKQLGTLTGMDDAYMDACMNNTELQNAILSRVTEAQGKYSIRSTPTFVFNDGAETLTGGADAAKFEEIVQKLSAGK